MATLSTAKIADKNSRFDSGAAFLLSQKSSINEVVPISPDQEVEVCKGSPYVVARIMGATNAVETFDNSHEIIQKGLDILSIKGREHLSTRGIFDDSLLWWRCSSGQVLRIISVAVLPIRMSAAGIVITNDGQVVPPPPCPPATYHESLRYFRLSQVADDVFEAFRNMYLAFEGLLEFVTHRNPGEREGDWLKRALAEAATNIPLDKVFRSTTSNVIDEIYQQIYQDIRCAVFHLKTGPRLLPQNLSDRKKVSEGQSKLARLVLALTENRLHYRYQMSMLFPEAHNGAARSLFSNSSVLISDSNLPFDKDETAESPAYKTAIEIKAEYRSELSEPGLVFMFGTAEAAHLAGIDRIGRVAIKKADKVLIATAIEAELNHSGIDVLEFQLGTRLLNKGMPKYQYGA